jgi:predicted rRNA methylase YqxC with S4 and FtsJ domains
MRTITIEIAQNDDYVLLLALLQKFTDIKISEKPQLEEKRDMSKYWGCLSNKQTIEEIDQQLNEMRSEWERDTF